MRVQLVDPRADVPQYDHALSAALARQGAQVELVTSHFVHGPIRHRGGYAVSERFYRRATSRAAGAGRSRRALRLLEHAPDMLRFRRLPGDADVRHYQWLPLEPLDAYLIPPARPRVMTLHNVLRRRSGRVSAVATRRVAERMDAVVVHTRHGAHRLQDELGIDPERIRVIPHGAFEHLLDQPQEVPLPPELAAVRGPVVLSFGTIRPYKGVDVLLEAFRQVEGAELWIVGRPLRGSLEPYRRLASRVPGRVRFVARYVTEPEIPAFLRRADVVALPYRTIDQSGVLYTALAFGKPMVLSAVGGFVEVAEEHGAARLVPPEDPDALAASLTELLADAGERRALAERAGAAAAGAYSWDAIARRTLELYGELLS